MASQALAAGESCSGLFSRVEENRAAKIAAAEEHALKFNEINYKIDGANNTETVILLHGLGSSLKTYDKVSPELSDKYRVISYDQRGHGTSVARGEDYSTYQMAADLKVLVDHLGLKKVHLVGHSLGARTAMRFADMYPEFVQSLVFEDMDMRQRQDPAPEKVAKHLRLARAFAGMHSYYSQIEDVVKIIVGEFGGDPEKARRYIESKVEVDQKTGAVSVDSEAPVRIYFGFQGNVDDFGPALQKLQVPVLFLRADPSKSPFFDDKGLAHIQAYAHNYHVENFVGAEHTIHKDESLPRYLEILKKFLVENK